jgi:hypothetical protein
MLDVKKQKTKQNKRLELFPPWNAYPGIYKLPLSSNQLAHLVS